MSGAVLLTTPTRVEAVGLLASLRAAQIDARTSPTERWQMTDEAPGEGSGVMRRACADDIAVILALDLASVDLEAEVDRCRAVLGRHVPAVVVADHRHRTDPHVATVPGHVVDSAADTSAVVLMLRSLLAQVTTGVPMATDLSTRQPTRPSAAQIGPVGGPVGGLTAREEEIADLASSGLRNEQIADQLQISVHTVRTHLGRVLAKLDVQHRVALHARLRQLRGSSSRSSAAV